MVLSIVNPGFHSPAAVVGSESIISYVRLGLFFPHAYLTFISIEFHLPSHMSYHFIRCFCSSSQSAFVLITLDKLIWANLLPCLQEDGGECRSLIWPVKETGFEPCRSVHLPWLIFYCFDKFDMLGNESMCVLFAPMNFVYRKPEQTMAKWLLTFQLLMFIMHEYVWVPELVSGREAAENRDHRKIFLNCSQFNSCG